MIGILFLVEGVSIILFEVEQRLVEGTGRVYDGVNPVLTVTVHETDNRDAGADAVAHAELQLSGNVRQASWHYTVDDQRIIQSFRDDQQCWHSGTAEGNKTSVAVEICVNEGIDRSAALRRAAWLVATLLDKHGRGVGAVRNHHDWTGKHCPAQLLDADGWAGFVDLVKSFFGGKEAPVSNMVSPFQGRVTAEWRGYKNHAGMDIAPPKPGQVGLPVYAAFAGTIKALNRTAPHGNLKSTWAPGRTGRGMLVANPDGEGNGYNHMTPLAGLKVGDKVKAGQLIGHNDTSGNQTGPHLHFELWASWKNPYSDYNPRLAFNKFGVTPGSAPKATSTPAKPKPAPKPAASPKDTNNREDNIAIEKALAKMGLDVGYPDGVNGDKQKAGVLAFQKQHGLVEDGYWGPATQEKFEYNKRLQEALNQMISTTPKLVVDGWIGTPTKRRKADVLKRNKWTNANLVANLKKVGAW